MLANKATYLAYEGWMLKEMLFLHYAVLTHSVKWSNICGKADLECVASISVMFSS